MRTNDVRQGRGKVARSPVDVRNVVNQAMRDGKPQAEIIAEFAELCSSASFALWRESSRFPSFPKSMKSVASVLESPNLVSFRPIQNQCFTLGIDSFTLGSF
jgi:hypothetical protein